MTSGTPRSFAAERVPAAFDVLMPTKDRPAFLERALRYYRLVGMDQTIRIVDGSDHPGADANAETCRRFGDELRIEHLVCGPQASIWDRLSLGLENTDAPYVAMTADDDFLVPDGMRSAADRLRSAPSASAAVGVVMRRDVVRLGATVRVTYDLYEQLARPEGDVELRLAGHADRPATLFYALRRTDVARRTCRRIAALRLDEDLDGHFGELLDTSLQVIAGPVLFTERLVGVRELGNAGQTSVRWGRDPLARIRDARWHERVDLMENVFAAAIRETDRPPSDPDAVSRAYVDRLMARLLFAKLSQRLSAPLPRGRFQQRYLPMLWPPTFLRCVLWNARRLPRTSREVRARLRSEDIRLLRMIHALAGP